MFSYGKIKSIIKIYLLNSMPSRIILNCLGLALVLTEHYIYICRNQLRTLLFSSYYLKFSVARLFYDTYMICCHAHYNIIKPRYHDTLGVKKRYHCKGIIVISRGNFFIPYHKMYAVDISSQSALLVVLPQ